MRTLGVAISVNAFWFVRNALRRKVPVKNATKSLAQSVSSNGPLYDAIAVGPTTATTAMT